MSISGISHLPHFLECTSSALLTSIFCAHLHIYIYIYTVYQYNNKLMNPVKSENHLIC